VSGAGPALSACSVGSSTIGRLPTPSLRVVFSGAGRRHLASVRARRRYSGQPGCRDADLQSAPGGKRLHCDSRCDRPISCTDQVARGSSMTRQCSLLSAISRNSTRPRVNRGTGSSGPAALPATTRTPTTRRWTGAVRGDSPGTVAVCDGGALVAAPPVHPPETGGPFLL